MNDTLYHHFLSYCVETFGPCGLALGGAAGFVAIAALGLAFSWCIVKLSK